MVEKGIYEAAADAAAAFAAAKAAADAAGVRMVLGPNVGPDGSVPGTMALAIVPVWRRRPDGERGNALALVAALAVPRPEAILESPGGEAWAREALYGACIERAMPALRGIASGDASIEDLPRNAAGFIATPARDAGLTWFRENAATYVAALNSLFRRRVVSVATLRQILASASYAEATLPAVPQATWDRLLERMLNDAAKEGRDPGVVRVWRETRHTVHVEPPRIDAAALDSLFDGA